MTELSSMPVSYTHLDVYKRQGYDWTDYTIDFDAQINNTSKDATGVMLRSTSDFKTGYMLSLIHI